MQIEIWSDVVCPWCYIGKRRFEAGLAAFQAEHPDVQVEVAYRSFQLDPTAPLGPGEPVAEGYARKFGGPEKAAEILETVTTEAAGEGLEFRMDIAKRSNTQSAHRMIALADTLGLQAEMKERLMQAYFTEGLSVGVDETLVDLAVEIGIDAETARAWLAGDGGKVEVLEHLQDAATFGISSVPTFVFDRQAALPGAQSGEVFAQALAKMAST